jgi:hypothetical protein
MTKQEDSGFNQSDRHSPEPEARSSGRSSGTSRATNQRIETPTRVRRAQLSSHAGPNTNEIGAKRNNNIRVLEALEQVETLTFASAFAMKFLRNIIKMALVSLPLSASSSTHLIQNLAQSSL